MSTDSTQPGREGLDTRLPNVSRQDLAMYVKEGRRLRDEEINRVARSLGRGIVRLHRGVIDLVTGRRGRSGRTGHPAGAEANPL